MHTLKKFIHYYGPYKVVFFIDLLCAAIISLVDLSYPQILRTATKTLFTQDKSMILHALPWIGIGLFLMYVIQSLCKYYVSYQGHMMGANMERDMRQQLFEHYEELSFSYYSQNNSGQMMSKLVSDLFDISEFAHHCHVFLLFPSESEDAADIHGKQKKNRGCQCQPAGYFSRHPCGSILYK